MSRRQLPFVIVAIASLALSACSAAPTAPSGAIMPGTSRSDVFTNPPADTTQRSGFSNSNG